MEVVRLIIQLGVVSFLPLMMLALGLSLDYREIWRCMRHPVIWRGLLVGAIAVPLLAIVVVALLPLRPMASGIILLMAFAPGCPIIVVRVRRQKGNTAAALALTLVLTAAAIVMLPLALVLLRAFFPFEFHTSALGVLGKVAPSLLIPLALGLGARSRAPKLAAKLASVVVWAFKAVFAVLVVTILVIGIPHLARLTVWAVLAMLLVTTGAAVIGEVAGGKRAEDRALLATAAIYGNPAIALYVAQTSYPALEIAPLIALYVLLRLVAQIPFKQWQRWHVRPPLSAAPR